MTFIYSGARLIRCELCVCCVLRDPIVGQKGHKVFSFKLFQHVATKSTFNNKCHDLFGTKTFSFDPQDFVTIMKVEIYFVTGKMLQQNINDPFCVDGSFHICFENFDHRWINFI
jgi:hypothetical protein